MATSNHIRVRSPESEEAHARYHEAVATSTAIASLEQMEKMLTECLERNRHLHQQLMEDLYRHHVPVEHREAF